MNRPRTDCKVLAVNILLPLHERRYRDQYWEDPSNCYELLDEAAVDYSFEVDWLCNGEQSDHTETCNVVSNVNNCQQGKSNDGVVRCLLVS